MRQRIESQAALLDRLHGEISGLDSLEEEATSVKKDLVALAPRLLAARSTAEAGAELSALLRSRTQSVHARFVRVVVDQGPSQQAVPGKVKVRLDCETDGAGVEALLALLSSGDPILVPESIRIAAVSPRDRSAQVEQLQVSLSVSAWWMAGPATSDTAGAVS